MKPNAMLVTLVPESSDFITLQTRFMALSSLLL